MKCPKLLKVCTLSSFTICPECCMLITNGDYKYVEHPMAQGPGKGEENVSSTNTNKVNA